MKNAKRKFVGTREFVSALVDVARNDGSMSDLALKLGLHSNYVRVRISRLNALMRAAGKPLLPELKRNRDNEINLNVIEQLIRNKIARD